MGPEHADSSRRRESRGRNDEKEPAMILLVKMHVLHQAAPRDEGASAVMPA